MPLDVSNQSLKPRNRVVDLTECDVAVNAQKRTVPARQVAVVDVKAAPAARRVSSTGAAPAALCDIHGIPLFDGDAIRIFQRIASGFSQVQFPRCGCLPAGRIVGAVAGPAVTGVSTVPFLQAFYARDARFAYSFAGGTVGPGVPGALKGYAAVAAGSTTLITEGAAPRPGRVTP